MLKVILGWAVLAAGLIVLVKIAVVWAEPHLVFQPTAGLTIRPDQLGIGFQEYRLQTLDQETVIAWELTHPEPRAQVVFFHGNAGNLSEWLEFLVQIRALGVNVHCLDYRGYGESTGSPSETGLYLDVDAFLDHFWKKHKHSERRVVFWGRSLGGPVAAYAARDRKPHGLILEATFPSKSSLLTHWPFYRILSPFSRYRFPTSEYVADHTYPVLVIHGDGDEVIPTRQGELLYESLKGPKSYYLVAGATHNDTQAVGLEAYWKRISTFVDSVVAGDEPGGTRGTSSPTSPNGPE